jgi:hypothetical protein
LDAQVLLAAIFELAVFRRDEKVEEEADLGGQGYSRIDSADSDRGDKGHHF